VPFASMPVKPSRPHRWIRTLATACNYQPVILKIEKLRVASQEASRLGLSLLSFFTGNCVLSPRSVGGLLAMLAHGADREAREEIDAV